MPGIEAERVEAAKLYQSEKNFHDYLLREGDELKGKLKDVERERDMVRAELSELIFVRTAKLIKR